MHKQKFATIFFILSINSLLLFILFTQMEAIQAVQPIPPNTEPYTALQNPDHQPEDFGGGGFATGPDDVSDEQRAAIEARLNQNIQSLGLVDALDTEAEPVSFIFPLRGADHFTDYGFHSTTNFVDQDPSNGSRDYQCGNITYNGHKGTDYFLWPFGWNKMDNKDVEVIAAADGIIIGKDDGNQDRSCTWQNAPLWNAVYIQHADGSIAWYGHLKKGSLLTKWVGDSVTAGEYLGLVGSSGMSSGPHLHFELKSTSYKLQDPYAGACNALNTESWWTQQRPYYDSAINKLTTGSAEVQFRACSQHDISHEKTQFIPGETVYFTAYYRDQLNTQPSQYTIRRPDNTIFQQWTHNSDEPQQNISYWFWAYTIPHGEQAGTWNFTADYEGQLYQQPFQLTYPIYITVTSPTGGEEWLPNETHTITWQSVDSNNVQIDLYKSNIYSTTLTASTPDDGQFSWTIPLSPTLAPDYQIRVSNTLSPTKFADSNHFAIGVMEKVYLPMTLRE